MAETEFLEPLVLRDREERIIESALKICNCPLGFANPFGQLTLSEAQQLATLT